MKQFLLKYGVTFSYKIDIDDNLRTEINNSIDYESKDIMSKPFSNFETNKSNNFNFPKRRKKEVDDKTIFGNLIKEEEAIDKIGSIVGENDSIVIEAKVFGIDEFVPSSKAFKILTLKVTDYTDSILAKVFIRDDEYMMMLRKKQNLVLGLN